MMMMFSGGKDDNDDRHHQWVAKSRAIDLEGGKGVRNDKVVTSNLAFARGHISLILLRPRCCWNNIFCQIDEKWARINNVGYHLDR